MDSQTKILDELNELNDPAKPLTKTNVSISGLTDHQGYDGWTEGTVTAVPGRGYSGSISILYRRIDLAQRVDGTSIKTPEALTPEQLLMMINNLHGLDLTTADVDVLIGAAPTEGVPSGAYIEAVEGSYGYISSAQIVTLYGKWTLKQVIGRRRLDKLDHPIAKPLRGRSARMLTWDKDFTSIRDALKPTAFSRYTDWATVQNACAVYGIPMWTESTIVDRAVADVPDANPAFDRVVIQAIVESTELFGSLYFHYNVLEEI